ncbi:Ig-like domain-containing protein [Leptospira sp. 2 VSF19]|uniref:Ig-like domain-containing protein n=1 Tax=Leptospira soteropolitanensis TaxID=2950025 RepID=A0ABT3MD00_9LEPT|nr:Ig-like domain-containing protein [Leptospira soteropolitanensis]MCW7524778.1 Ig-like domain-containing protein [Leptospira soteropolitanensis]
MNPFVYDLLNPILEEEKKAGLLDGGLLLALNGFSSSLYITGVIRNGSGIAQINKEYSVIASESNTFGPDSSGITDSSGRFFLSIGPGDTNVRVTELGEDLVTFTLNVSGPEFIQVKNVNPINYEISSIIPYAPTNKPAFFELISTSPANNETYIGVSPDLTLTFSDTLPEWDFSTLTTLVANNVSVTPSGISLLSPSLSPPNTIIIMTNVSTYDIEYTVQIGPGFYSTNGIPLTPRSVKFRLETLP